MKQNLLYLGIATILSIAGGIAVLNWLTNDNELESFLFYTLKEKDVGIESLNVELRDQNVILNIFLSKPLSCNEVFETLGVEDLPLRGKIYSPVCTSVRPEKIIITYKEIFKT